jgi:hypothetical protein
MAKHQSAQKYVLKIDTNRLKSCDWNLSITFEEALQNDEIIALADSTTLRFIDDINGVDKIAQDTLLQTLRSRLKVIKKDKNNYNSRNEIKEIYSKINELSFRKDYLCLVANNKTDYKRAVKGFYINGTKFIRLLGTAGQLKKSTVVFVSERIHDELLNRLENGRNPNDKFIPSKYNAYLSLACSSSTPVSTPNFIVVKDCLTNFQDTYISVSDSDTSNEPILEIKTDTIENNANDGFGLISPSFAEKWSEELKLDYRFSGCCIRNAFLKGMLFCFDFHAFADKFAKNHIVTDVWGNERDITKVDVIITESMLKLWSSYSSYEDYVNKCNVNGFTFSVTKVTPKSLDNIRNLNYQYLQSYKLTENDIDALIKPTINNINDVLTNDINKTILFLKGYFVG